MARNDDAKQVNVVMSEEEKKELDKFCQSTGLSINAAMNKARELLLVDSLRVKAPDQASNIEEFELLVNKIMVAYKSSIERSLDADERARSNVKNQLDGLEVIAKNNTELQQKLEEANKKVAELKVALEEANKKVAEQEDIIAKNKKENADVAALKAEKLELSQKIAELETEHAKEIKKLQDENFEKILKIVNAK